MKKYIVCLGLLLTHKLCKATLIDYRDIDYDNTWGYGDLPTLEACEEARDEGKDFYCIERQLLLVDGGIEVKKNG